MARKSLKSAAIGIILLVIGVIAGVLLVQRSQDIRNRAKETEVQFYTICHKDSVTGRKEEIEVDRFELEERLNQGDILGECPKD